LDCQQRISWTGAYDKTKFHVDQKRSLRNELAALVATYRMGGDKSALRMALDLIDSANKDRSLWSLQENVALYKLDPRFTAIRLMGVYFMGLRLIGVCLMGVRVMGTRGGP